MQEKRQKKNIGEIIDKKYFTKEELQTHDRELVRQVCEKIRNHFALHTYASIDEQNIYEILDQIAKEFEDEE